MPSQALVPASKPTRTHSKSTENSPSETEQSIKSTSTEEVLEATDKILDEIDRILAIESVQALADKMKDDEPKKEYSLADAMREGATCTDQAIGAWTTPVGETCALSAAMLAVRTRGLA